MLFCSEHIAILITKCNCKFVSLNFNLQNYFFFVTITIFNRQKDSTELLNNECSYIGTRKF